MNLTVTTPCMEKPAAAKPKSDAFEAIYQPVARSPGQCLFASPPGEIPGPASPVGSISDQRTFTVTANKGCGVWMMASSLPHVTSNHVSYNGLYGMAVFSQKEGSGEFPGGHGAQESFSEDGDAVLWEAELENDDPLRRPIATALVERNSVSHNGGEHPPTPGLPRAGHCSATRLVPRPLDVRPVSSSLTTTLALLLPDVPFLPPARPKQLGPQSPHLLCVPPPAPPALVRGAETIRFCGCFTNSDRQ